MSDKSGDSNKVVPFHHGNADANQSSSGPPSAKVAPATRSVKHKTTRLRHHKSAAALLRHSCGEMVETLVSRAQEEACVDSNEAKARDDIPIVATTEDWATLQCRTQRRATLAASANAIVRRVRRLQNDSGADMLHLWRPGQITAVHANPAAPDAEATYDVEMATLMHDGKPLVLTNVAEDDIRKRRIFERMSKRHGAVTWEDTDACTIPMVTVAFIGSWLASRNGVPVPCCRGTRRRRLTNDEADEEEASQPTCFLLVVVAICVAKGFIGIAVLGYLWVVPLLSEGILGFISHSRLLQAVGALFPCMYFCLAGIVWTTRHLLRDNGVLDHLGWIRGRDAQGRVTTTAKKVSSKHYRKLQFYVAGLLIFYVVLSGLVVRIGYRRAFEEAGTQIRMIDAGFGTAVIILATPVLMMLWFSIKLGAILIKDDVLEILTHMHLLDNIGRGSSGRMEDKWRGLWDKAIVAPTLHLATKTLPEFSRAVVPPIIAVGLMAGIVAYTFFCQIIYEYKSGVPASQLLHLCILVPLVLFVPITFIFDLSDLNHTCNELLYALNTLRSNNLALDDDLASLEHALRGLNRGQGYGVVLMGFVISSKALNNFMIKFVTLVAAAAPVIVGFGSGSGAEDTNNGGLTNATSCDRAALDAALAAAAKLMRSACNGAGWNQTVQLSPTGEIVWT